LAGGAGALFQAVRLLKLFPVDGPLQIKNRSRDIEMLLEGSVIHGKDVQYSGKMKESGKFQGILLSGKYQEKIRAFG